ncbi:hypothetical protein PMAYCL1PPCAC_22537 [Pristionchus mayeri]|uniref:Uncharacterized protein n=1 Tax=Pristionchus mayeri TaxID=1317129 RepID=A0AAN5CYF9_9BILA|nr:hypothetical protein PMAYCL1PPCAC_22537 [Pristionchus mayeri]
MHKCQITGNFMRPLVDNDVLFHLVNQPLGSVDLDIRDTNVTAGGLARAFKVLQACKKELSVRCFVSTIVLCQYLSTLGEGYRKLCGHSITMYAHTSGAYLRIARSFNSLENDRNTGACAIVMRSSIV